MHVGTYLEQSRDGIRSDTSVRVGDEILHVEIAGGDSLRLGLGKLVKGLDRGEFEDSLW